MVKKKPDKGLQAFYISDYDPRMPHPRQLISRNYHHIQSNPVLANLFPRKNLVAGTRRLKNLSELLSPTVQSSDVTLAGDDHADNLDGNPSGRWNGSYHCKSYKEKGKCDICSYMVETSYVESYYFERKFAIHDRNIHLPASHSKEEVNLVCLSSA